MSAHAIAPTRPYRDTFDRAPGAIGRDPVPFPAASATAPYTAWHADWRRRLASNLARRSDGRWDPLTWTHG